MTLPRDKQLHLLAGLIIAIITSLLLLHFFPAINIAITSAIGAVFSGIVGWLKETWYDARHPITHTVDVNDFLATLCGGCLGTVILVLGYTLYF